MGLYVCSKNFQLSSVWLMNFKGENCLVIDTDDLTVESYTCEMLRYCFFNYIAFENLYLDEETGNLEVNPMFNIDKLVEIKPLDILIYTGDGRHLYNYKIYFCGRYFEFQSSINSFFPDFFDDELMIFHDIPMVIEGVAWRVHRTLEFSKRDLSAKIYDGNGSYDILKSTPCTRASFMSRLVLGV